MNSSIKINPIKEQIKLYAKQLKTPTFTSYEKVIRQLTPGDGYDKFLCELLKQELSQRQVTSQKRRIKKAVGLKACHLGFNVRFYTAMNLANKLAEAVQDHRLSKLEKSLAKIDLLIIDELSYLTFNRYQSEMLFQVISERSERASVIITTNLEFSRWIELFENEIMVAALIDRVTFRAHILDMNVKESYRLEETLLKRKNNSAL